MATSKRDIRAALLRAREHVDPKVAQELGEVIARNVKSLQQFQHAKVIHTYVSSKKNEVDTRTLIEDALKSGKRVVVPVTNVDLERLDHSEIFSLDELRPGTFGILEPTMIRPINLALVDLVLVPVVGVDRKGNRIGFGKGYYDRFLKIIRKPRIALAYAFQVLEEVPKGQDDVAVDFVVTEKEIIQCT